MTEKDVAAQSNLCQNLQLPFKLKCWQLCCFLKRLVSVSWQCKSPYIPAAKVLHSCSLQPMHLAAEVLYGVRDAVPNLPRQLQALQLLPILLRHCYLRQALVRALALVKPGVADGRPGPQRSAAGSEAGTRRKGGLRSGLVHARQDVRARCTLPPDAHAGCMGDRTGMLGA